MQTPISQNEQVKCLSLKDKAQKLISDANTSIINQVTALGKSLVAVVLSPVKELSNLIENITTTASDNIQRILELPQTASKSVAEKRKLIEKKIREFREPTDCDLPKASTLPASSSDIPPQIIGTNVFAEIVASPSSNDDSLLASQLAKQKKQLEDANSKSISAKKDVIYNVIKSASTDGIPVMREKVRQMYGKSEEIDAMLKTLPLGNLMSEYLGGSILADVVDKPSLNLINWKDGTPKVLRENIKLKLNDDTAEEIENIYTKTNSRLYENLPKEFKDEENGLGLNISHAFHIAGDFGYYKNHLNKDTMVGKLLKATALASIGEDAKHLNYINPVIDNITIGNNAVLVFEENYEVPVDNRKNIIRWSFKNNADLTKIEK